MQAWDTSCPDWEERILSGRTLVPDLPLFQDEAARAVRVFNRLRIPDVIGKPTMAEAGTEWLLPIVAAIFGAYDPSTNRRMIQEFFWMIPKKNSKSSGAAAVMVTVLILNRRPLAEGLLIAPTKQIADIAYKQAWGIIQADPELAKLFHGQQHIRLITHRNTKATMQIKAADTDAITGSKATYTLIDETHVFAKKPRAADIFVEIRGALAARPDGLLIQVTTQSKDSPAGVFKQELDTARKVRDGEMRLPLLPILYELPQALVKDGGWKNRKYWPLVNPNMGKSVDETFLANELLKAEENGPAALALLASQHFNVQIGLGLQTDRWAGADFWERSADAAITLQEIMARSEVIVVGIDGGGLDDLLGLAVLGRCATTRRWLLWCHAWAHEIVLERRKDIAARLRDFEMAGNLTMVKRPGDDVMAVADVVTEIRDVGLLPEGPAIAVDSVGIGDIVDELTSEGRGIALDRIIGISQGFRLNGAIKTTERRLAGGDLVHGGTGLMAWCVGNAKAEARGNAIMITKQAAGSAKIDPLMATFNAVTLMATNPASANAGMSGFLSNPVAA